MATLIRVDGSSEEVVIPKNGSLKAMQTAVGGNIEVGGIAPDGRTILCDEEGLLCNKEPNPTAFSWGLPLVGDILLVTDGKEFK